MRAAVIYAPGDVRLEQRDNPKIIAPTDAIIRLSAGFQSSCQHREFVGGAQAELLRVPLADGTLVATPRAAG